MPRGDQKLPIYNRATQLWDFSGVWSIDLAGVLGQMTVKDIGGNVTGTYILRDGTSGVFEGIHDGEYFSLYLHRGNRPIQIHVSGPVDKRPAPEIELKGSAILQTPSSSSVSGWAEQSYGNGRFVASARAG